MQEPEAVRYYTKLNTITTRWPTEIGKAAALIMPTTRECHQ